MSARDEILAAARAAVADAAGQAVDVPRDYRSAAGPQGDLVDLFAERVADYRARVIRVTESEVPGVLTDVIGGRSVIVPDGFPYDVTGGVVDAGQSSPELDAIEVVVTAAAVGIAVTGTIVLDHGPGQGRRALSLVPDTHLCVVRADQVVAGVPEAVAQLDPRRPQTWISGPSATSDIELNRVEGVHGPRNLVVLLVV